MPQADPVLRPPGGGHVQVPVLPRNIRSLLFDFGGTSFMDSSGIGMIIGRYKMMRFMGGNVLAIHVGEQMRRLLTMSGIYKVIDIYEGLPQQSGLV